MPMRKFVWALLLSAALPAADPITVAFKARYQTQKLNFNESATAMPEENLLFRLTPEQRPFADWLEHTADMNYRMCSQIMGQPAPGDTGVKGVQTKGKAAIQKVLSDSFVYCDKLFDGLTDAKALSDVPAMNRQIPAVDIMFSYIANLNAHYGNLVGYMRVKGVVPPSTARSKKK